MKSIMLALALSLGLAGGALGMTKDEADSCKTGDKNITFSKLQESWNSDGAKVLAAQYGVRLINLDADFAQQFIKLADEAEPASQYPGTIEKVTRIVIFAADPEKISKSRVFVYATDDCLLFQLDWSAKLVNALINQIAKDNV